MYVPDLCTCVELHVVLVLTFVCVGLLVRGGGGTETPVSCNQLITSEESTVIAIKKE